MVNEATQRMTIESTSKENDYSKHCVNYFQSWHMGITNKLLQKAIQKHEPSLTWVKLVKPRFNPAGWVKSV